MLLPIAGLFLLLYQAWSLFRKGRHSLSLAEFPFAPVLFCIALPFVLRISDTFSKADNPMTMEFAAIVAAVLALCACVLWGTGFLLGRRDRRLAWDAIRRG